MKLTLLLSERSELHGVLALLSAIGLMECVIKDLCAVLHII